MMVQRKEPNKPKSSSKAEATKRNQCSQDREKNNSLVSDSKKKLHPKPPTIEVAVSPNYMKPTSSSGSKKVRSSHPSSCDGNQTTENIGCKFFPKKSSGTLLFPSEKASTATCSSILKDSKFPQNLKLELNPPGIKESEGISTIKVCPFTYCSLNGHWKRSLPSLASFVSARRRVMRTQKNIRLKKRPSPSRKMFTSRKDDDDEDFFVEIYAGPRENDNKEEEYEEDGQEEEEEEEEMDSDAFSELMAEASIRASTRTNASSLEDEWGDYSEISYDEVLDQVDELVDLEAKVLAGFLDYMKDREDSRICKSRSVDEDSSTENGDDDYEIFLKAIDLKYHCSDLEIESTGSCNIEVEEEEEEEDGDDDDVISEEDIGFEEMELLQQFLLSLESDGGESSRSGGEDDIESIENKNNPLSLKIGRRDNRYLEDEEEDLMKRLDARSPNLLAVEPDPEAEKVDLKHQEMEERKNAEEWMVDRALQALVTKLAPARNKKVALIVEAIETIR